MIRILIVCTTMVAATAAPGWAQPSNIHLSFDGGRVTLHASDARLGDILAAWAEVGGARIDGMEQVADRADRVVSLNLLETDESGALASLLGADFGFVSLQRPAQPGRSSMSRIVIARSSAALAGSGATMPMADIPETRYSYASPLTGFSPEALEALERMAAEPPPVVVPSLEPPVMPELRFQYASPMAPAVPEAEPPSDARARTRPPGQR